MKVKNIMKTLRVALSFIFLWAFVDKLFGLGFATSSENSWISGASPTSGFLANATQGPFADFFQGLTGQGWVDWLFMAGLLGIGLAFLLNKYIKFTSIAGAILMLLMYLAALPPQNNPLIDEHIIYILVFLLFYFRENQKN